MRYTVSIICSILGWMSASEQPFSTSWRKSLAYSRNLLLSRVLSRPLDSEQRVSAKHLLGMRPYLVMRLCSMSHCPPSFRGSLSRNETKRPSTGSPLRAVSTMLFRKKLHRSTLSQKKR
uniref:Uncharacterized protein n=1 Tax=Ixodes ricinus TaxID=34613 RepID=A0A6B0UN71_IXORI